MRELSLHVLDLIENAIRAGASLISVTVLADPDQDRLTITVEDNGSGLTVKPEEALDPFFTTKEGKRVGLGLSLFRATAEEAGGTLTLEDSPLGGLSVRASMQFNHIDRRPMGDLAATLSSVVCTNPHLDIWCRILTPIGEHLVRVSDIAKDFRASDRCGLAIARRVAEKIKAGLAATRI